MTSRDFASTIYQCRRDHSVYTLFRLVSGLNSVIVEVGRTTSWLAYGQRASAAGEPTLARER